jgi:RHS repeat-associated protein
MTSTAKIRMRNRVLRRTLLAIILLPAFLVAADLLLPSSGARAFRYDSRGRLIGRIMPGGRLIRYEYDKAGLLYSVSYHRVGRITRWAYPSLDVVHFEHDAAGNTTAMEDRSGRTLYEYDEDEHLKEITTPDRKKITYEYDSWGDVRRVSSGGAFNINYQRDATGSISQTNDGQGQAVHYRWQPDLNQLIRLLPNGISTVYEYSPWGAIASIRHTTADGLLIGSYSYEYDAEGRVVRADETTPAGTSTTRYEYDLVGRLAKVRQPDGSVIAYEYNLAGNCTARTDTRGTIHYQYDAQGRLAKAGTVTFEYDHSGNVILRRDGDQQTRFKYDVDNRLAEVRANGVTIRYGYDGNGNLVRREANGKTTRYLNDVLSGMQQVAAEYDDNGKMSSYLIGRSRVERSGPNGETVYFLEDLLGSTRCLVNKEGEVLARYEYTPFGSPTSDGEIPPTEFLYGGEMWDGDARLLFLRARFYDPEIGRFISADPAQGSPLRPETFNQYVYANNDPVNQMDPLGLQSIWRQPPPPPFYDPNWYLRDLRQERARLQLFQPPPPPPREDFDWRAEMQAYYWLPSNLRNSTERPREDFSFGTELWNTTRRGEWLHADSPIQHDLRGALYLLSLHPIGKPVGWTLFASDRLYDLHHDQYGQLIFGVGKKGASLWNENLGKVITVANAGNEFRQGAILPWAVSTARDVFKPRRSSDALDELSKYDPFVAGPLDRTRNIFYPPPGGGGGGGGLPLVGGVYLDETAKIVGELGSISGASYDASTGRLILIGDKQRELPPMKPEYLAEAIRAVYAESPHEPGMTIDPNPQNPLSSTMLVRFFGNTENTRIGHVMFECDRIMKSLSVGVDNLTKQPVRSEVPGYQSVAAMTFADALGNRGLWSRFWLVPEPVAARVSEDGSMILFDPIKIRVKTQTMRWADGKLVPAGGIEDPHAENFANTFTDHYEDLAKENPVYGDLKQVASAVALAKWMKQQNVPVDWNFVHIFAGTPYATPETTPAAYSEQTQTQAQERGVLTRKIMIIGGVEMTPQLQTQSNTDASRLHAQLAAEQASADKQAKSSFRFQFDGKTYEAVALRPVNQREPGGFQTSTSDVAALLAGSPEMAGLPGLTRYYNSLHNEATEYGFSWSLLLPRLEVEAEGEKGAIQYLSVGGDVSKRVRAQRFTLTNQFGLGQERFSRPFMDDGLNRIGFAPEQTGSQYRGLYPEQDGSYRLFFANRDQAIFDSGGGLRAMLTPSSKALYDYDRSNRLVGIRFSSNKYERQVRLEYDSSSRLSSCDAGTARATYEYDSEGNLSRVTSGGHALAYRYDDKRLLAEVILDGETMTHSTYDEKGDLLKQRDPAGAMIEQNVERSPEGKIVTIKQGADYIKQHYDANLRLTETEDNRGAAYHYIYDDRGRLTAIHASLPTGGTMKIETSADGKVVTVEDPRKIRREYRFGSNGKLAELLVNNKPAAVFRYDGNDNLVEIGYKDGAAEHYAYDKDGRVLEYRRINAGNEGASSDPISFSYDEQGNLAGISNGPAGQRPIDRPVFQNGGAERVKIERQADGETIKAVVTGTSAGERTQYHFTSAGLLLSVEDPYRAQTRYSYDDKNRLRRIEFADGRSVEYSYDPHTAKLSEEWFITK